MNKLKIYLGETFTKRTALCLLYMLFTALLVAANAMATKQVPIGKWFGIELSITVGIICYPFTFLITDIIGEIWGKKEAQIAVIGGLFGQIVAMVLIVIANVIKGSDGTVDANFANILGSNWILTIGSLLACFLSQSWDVWVFHKIRDKYIAKHGSTKGGRWIWNNVSTITSQLIDSVVFYIFLLIMLSTLGVHLPASTCAATIFAYWIIKVAIAIADTPIFYLCTNKYKRKKENGNGEDKEQSDISSTL